MRHTINNKTLNVIVDFKHSYPDLPKTNIPWALVLAAACAICLPLGLVALGVPAQQAVTLGLGAAGVLAAGLGGLALVLFIVQSIAHHYTAEVLKAANELLKAHDPKHARGEQ